MSNALLNSHERTLMGMPYIYGMMKPFNQRVEQNFKQKNHDDILDRNCQRDGGNSSKNVKPLA